jgi:hypothetical protein
LIHTASDTIPHPSIIADGVCAPCSPSLPNTDSTKDVRQGTPPNTPPPATLPDILPSSPSTNHSSPERLVRTWNDETDGTYVLKSAIFGKPNDTWRSLTGAVASLHLNVERSPAVNLNLKDRIETDIPRPTQGCPSSHHCGKWLQHFTPGWGRSGYHSVTGDASGVELLSLGDCWSCLSNLLSGKSIKVRNMVWLTSLCLGLFQLVSGV